MEQDARKLTRRQAIGIGVLGLLAGWRGLPPLIVAAQRLWAWVLDLFLVGGTRPPIIIKGGSLTIELHRDWRDASIEEANEQRPGRYLYELDTSNMPAKNKDFTVTIISITADGVEPLEKVPSVKRVELVLAGKDVQAESFYVTFEDKRILFDCQQELKVADDVAPKKRTHKGYSGAYFRIREGTLTLTNNDTRPIRRNADVTYFVKVVTNYD